MLAEPPLEVGEPAAERSDAGEAERDLSSADALFFVSTGGAAMLSAERVSATAPVNLDMSKPGMGPAFILSARSRWRSSNGSMGCGMDSWPATAACRRLEDSGRKEGVGKLVAV